MAACLLCGEDTRPLTRLTRLWSPDDGWQLGRLCRACAATELRRRPQPEDYAYDKRGLYVSDEQAACDALFG